MGIFNWWSRRRRRRLIDAATPDEWIKCVERLWFFSALNTGQKQTITNTTKVLVAEKNWEGCGGLTITDEIRVTIAAQIAWLVVGMRAEYFDHVESILVYPDAYVAPGRQPIGGGLVIEGDSARQGEAWYRGPVILSWDDVKAGGLSRNHGHNLVLHEFAHQLDFLNGRDADGVPGIESANFARRWLDVTQQEYDALQQACRTGQPTVLDCYGTTNRAEFFAVATEAFFQTPVRLRDRHRELHDVLTEFYRR